MKWSNQSKFSNRVWQWLNVGYHGDANVWRQRSAVRLGYWIVNMGLVNQSTVGCFHRPVGYMTPRLTNQSDWKWKTALCLHLQLSQDFAQGQNFPVNELAYYPKRFSPRTGERRKPMWNKLTMFTWKKVIKIEVVMVWYTKKLQQKLTKLPKNISNYETSWNVIHSPVLCTPSATCKVQVG